MTVAVMVASFLTAHFRLVSLRVTCRSHDIVNMKRGLLPQVLSEKPSNRQLSLHHMQSDIKFRLQTPLNTVISSSIPGGSSFPMLLDRIIDEIRFDGRFWWICVNALTGPFGSGAVAAAAGDMTYQLAADSLCKEGMSQQQAAVAATVAMDSARAA
jgi:hypothetical protein